METNTELPRVAYDEWAEVNECLASHGYRPIRLAIINDNNRELQGLTVLREDSAASLRQMVVQVLTDSDRRASVVRRLSGEITRAKQAKHASSNKVRTVTAQLESLKEALEAEKEAVQREVDLRKADQELAAGIQCKLEARISQLQGKLKFCQAQNDRLSHESERLHQQIQEMESTDQHRRQRLDAVYTDLQQRRILTKQSLDRDVLNIVDMYEAKMEAMLAELEALRGPSTSSPDNSQSDSEGQHQHLHSWSSGEVDSQSSHLEHTEKLLAEQRAHVNALQMQLKAKDIEISGLPTPATWREAQSRIRELEQQLSSYRSQNIHSQQDDYILGHNHDLRCAATAENLPVVSQRIVGSGGEDSEKHLHGAEYYKFHLYKLRSMGKDKLRAMLSDICRVMNVSPEEIVQTLTAWSQSLEQGKLFQTLFKNIHTAAVSVINQQDTDTQNLGSYITPYQHQQPFTRKEETLSKDVTSFNKSILDSPAGTSDASVSVTDLDQSTQLSSLSAGQAVSIVSRMALKSFEYKRKLASTSQALKLIAGAVYPVFGRQLEATDSIDDLIETVLVLCDNYSQLQRRLDMHETVGPVAQSSRGDTEAQRVLQHAQMLFGVTDPSELIPVWSHIRGRLNASRQALTTICDVLNAPHRALSPDRVAQIAANIVSKLKQDAMQQKRKLEDVALALDCKPGDIYSCVHSVMARLRQYDAVLPILRNWIDTVLSLCGVNTLEQAIQYLTKLTDTADSTSVEKSEKLESSISNVAFPKQLYNEAPSALLERLDVKDGSTSQQPVSRRKTGQHSSPPSSIEGMLDDLAQFDLEASYMSSQDREDDFVLEACEHFLSSSDTSSAEASPSRKNKKSEHRPTDLQPQSLSDDSTPHSGGMCSPLDQQSVVSSELHQQDQLPQHRPAVSTTKADKDVLKASVSASGNKVFSSHTISDRDSAWSDMETSTPLRDSQSTTIKRSTSEHSVDTFPLHSHQSETTSIAASSSLTSEPVVSKRGSMRTHSSQAAIAKLSSNESSVGGVDTNSSRNSTALLLSQLEGSWESTPTTSPSRRREGRQSSASSPAALSHVSPTTTATSSGLSKKVTFSDDPDDVFCYQRPSSGDETPPKSDGTSKLLQPDDTKLGSMQTSDTVPLKVVSYQRKTAVHHQDQSNIIAHSGGELTLSDLLDDSVGESEETAIDNITQNQDQEYGIRNNQILGEAHVIGHTLAKSAFGTQTESDTSKVRTAGVQHRNNVPMIQQRENEAYNLRKTLRLSDVQHRSNVSVDPQQRGYISSSPSTSLNVQPPTTTSMTLSENLRSASSLPPSRERTRQWATNSATRGERTYDTRQGQSSIAGEGQRQRWEAPVTHWDHMQRLAQAIDDKNFSPSPPPSRHGEVGDDFS